MTEAASFSEIEEELLARAKRIVWCTASTVDTRGRTRSRILHPIWEGRTALIMTGRKTLKTKHLEANPHMSLCYWDPQHQQIYADCTAEWLDDPAEKARVWELFKTTEPQPYGYDPAMVWPDGLSDEVGVLRLTPWRVELAAMSMDPPGYESLVWKA